MTRKERTILGLAGVLGLAALAEGLMIQSLNTDNHSLRATGTALSGQITEVGTIIVDAQVNCDATQAEMAATSGAWKASSDSWGQRALMAEAALAGTAGAPTPTLESPTPTNTVTPTPKGQVCYVPVLWTPTLKATVTPYVTITPIFTPTVSRPSETPVTSTLTPGGGGGDHGGPQPPEEKSDNPNNGDDRGDSGIPDGDTGTIPGQP